MIWITIHLIILAMYFLHPVNLASVKREYITTPPVCRFMLWKPEKSTAAGLQLLTAFIDWWQFCHLHVHCRVHYPNCIASLIHQTDRMSIILTLAPWSFHTLLSSSASHLFASNNLCTLLLACCFFFRKKGKISAGENSKSSDACVQQVLNKCELNNVI